jgi:hypothetical protein
MNSDHAVSGEQASPTSGEGAVVVRGAGSGFAQDVLIGKHRFAVDEPLGAGGTDTGPTPYDLLLAARGLNVHDGRAVRAAKAVAPGIGHSASAPLTRPRLRLRGL